MDDSIKDMMPSEALESGWCVEYERSLKLIWSEIVRINTHLLLLERVSEFPWSTFVGPSPNNHFWAVTADVLFESVVMAIWRLCVDTDDEGLSIRQMKKRVLEHTVPSYLAEFCRLLKESQFEHNDSIETRIREIRHNYLVHSNAQKRLDPTPEDIRSRQIQIVSLREYKDQLNQFFDVLCFGHGRGVLPLGYLPGVTYPQNQDPRSDVEKILDDIADRSHVMQAYRDGGVEWELVSSSPGPDGVRIVEEYAVRLKGFEKYRDRS